MIPTKKKITTTIEIIVQSFCNLNKHKCPLVDHDYDGYIYIYPREREREINISV